MVIFGILFCLKSKKTWLMLNVNAKELAVPCLEVDYYSRALSDVNDIVIAVMISSVIWNTLL